MGGQPIRLCIQPVVVQQIYRSIRPNRKMQQPTLSLLQSLNPLIRLVKQRQELYFQLLCFVNRHIESSSNDLDNLTIFNRFISEAAEKTYLLRSREEELITCFVGQGTQVTMSESVTKEMLRFSSRLLQILEASQAKVRKSVFDTEGRTVQLLSRFKLAMNKQLKQTILDLRDYTEHVIAFTSKKYAKQLSKIQKYLQKIELGEDTCLRDFYTQGFSDQQRSSQQRKHKKEEPIRKLNFKLDIKKITPQQHNEKKHSMKKTLRPSTKRRQRVHRNRKQEAGDGQEQSKPNKEQTANKLLKFYTMLQLNRKEFLEDHIYEEVEQKKKEQELLAKLIERNRPINAQINNYIRKTQSFMPIPLIIIPPPNKSSGEERNESSLASKASLRTSFIISKRRPSFHLDSSGGEKNSDSQKHEPIPQSTIKNLNPRRRSSHSNHRQTAQKSNKKLFVVKPPMIFQDDMIPQAQVNQTQWLHTPIPNRYKDRRNDNIRLKKKNNPNPMENAFLPQSFRYLL